MQYSVRWSEQAVWNHPKHFSIAFMGKPVSIHVVSNKFSEPTTATFGGRLHNSLYYEVLYKTSHPGLWKYRH